MGSIHPRSGSCQARFAIDPELFVVLPGKSSVSDKVEDDADPSDLDVEIPCVALSPGRILNVLNKYQETAPDVQEASERHRGLQRRHDSTSLKDLNDWATDLLSCGSRHTIPLHRIQRSRILIGRQQLLKMLRPEKNQQKPSKMIIFM